MSLTFTDVKF